MTGRVCLVTGASHGIGRQIALDLAARGDRVSCVARPSPDLDAVVATAGAQAAAVPCDVRDPEAVQAAVAAAEDALGPLDVLVAAAGIEGFNRVADVPVDELRAVVETNLLGTMYAVRAALPGMVARGRGAIALFGSSSGDFPAPGNAAYAATKAGVASFAEALYAELVGTGVHAFVVYPGYVPGTKMSSGHATSIGEPPKFVTQDIHKVSAAVLRELDGSAVRLVRPRLLAFAPVVKILAPRLTLRATARTQRT